LPVPDARCIIGGMIGGKAAPWLIVKPVAGKRWKI
jgi:hypothetical protein